MSIKIYANDATLKTVSVTIQALIVDKKQMTLAVFRQLPVGRLLNDQGDLTGTPWGVVRYEIKDEGKLWIVYEADTILYRCPFPTKWGVWTENNEVNKAIEAYNSCQCIIPNFIPPSKEVKTYVPGKIITTHTYSEVEYKILEETERKKYLDEKAQIQQKYQERLQVYKEKIEDAKKKLDSAIIRTKKFNYHIEDFNKLPQLFIAV